MNNVQFGKPRLEQLDFPVISGTTGRTMIGIDVFARGADPRFFDLRVAQPGEADAYIAKAKSQRTFLHAIPVYKG